MFIQKLFPPPPIMRVKAIPTERERKTSLQPPPSIQAEYIRREIARKEEEKKRMRFEERSAVGIVLEASRPGSIMAFPVEPDPVCVVCGM